MAKKPSPIHSTDSCECGRCEPGHVCPIHGTKATSALVSKSTVTREALPQGKPPRPRAQR